MMLASIAAQQVMARVCQSSAVRDNVKIINIEATIMPVLNRVILGLVVAFSLLIFVAVSLEMAGLTNSGSNAPSTGIITVSNFIMSMFIVFAVHTKRLR